MSSDSESIPSTPTCSKNIEVPETPPKSPEYIRPEGSNLFRSGYRIPKRKQESPVKDYRSPLNRSRSRSPQERYNKRRCTRSKERSRSPRPQTSYHRQGARGEAAPQPEKKMYPYSRESGGRPFRSYGSRHYRSDKSPVTVSLEKMKIPRDMMRMTGEGPYGPSLIPPISASNVISPRPQEASMKPEKFTDSSLNKMIERAASNQDFSNKSVCQSKIHSKFKHMCSFFQKSVNHHSWVAMRKETIANTGLITQMAFLEEELAWVKECMESGGR